ncbi:LGFP repeat-containing protein [Corynebacterium antarcticum]|uniref:LGFP repeat-containing protein n=1 Tax=Corynebacterium antarcticum TaxID=2800405 RepID=UPI002006209C|nr:hypothetical protein [Corynebacterium antarcticum]MCK7660710.1 hypothetical protein [Corynebacterium antarcticum]
MYDDHTTWTPNKTTSATRDTTSTQPSAPVNEDSAAARANAEQEAIDNAAEAAATPAPGREDLEPAEPGFDDNTIDNDAGADWHATTDPEATITPGQMRSDNEDIPGGFTKEEADRAEVQEAAERQAQQDRAANPLARALAAAPVNCTTYWPSPYKVCGAIREKYDAIGGPTSFLTWPKSDELGVPDGVGRRNEFVNGFIYWHPTTGAHPVTTHFSTVWARNGWEAGRLGYPTTDELGLSDGIGRKQSFQRGHIYGSLAGLASIEGLIYDKWVTTGAEGGPLGYPTADEAGAPDGVGRFNRFVGGMLYWHPTHGAHPVTGDILDQWADQGYEVGNAGYPIGDYYDSQDGWYEQEFENTDIIGDISADPFDGGFYLPYISFPTPLAAQRYFDNEVTLAEAQEQSEENSVSARSLKKEYGPCVLNPSALHIRTDPRPDGDTGPYVAFKPQTQCGTKKAPIRVSSIHHHGRIMYKYYTKWNQAAENDVSNTNSSSLLQKKLEEKCDGTAVNTLLWGSAQGTIVYNGKTYYATVKPPQKKLDCRVH